MVTKMKMFDFSQNQVVKKVSSIYAPPPPPTPLFNQFNMASTMKMQNTGCNSCRS